MRHNHNYLPKTITEEISHDYGIEMSYHKAWKCREKALTYVKGSVEMSYQKLPSYLYMLEKKYLGTVTHVETNKVGQFKYCFMVLGVSICGFQSTRRLVLCVDGSFLNHKCRGHMLVAIALDANNQLYAVAFTVVDSKNDNSWMYFMLKLREIIREVKNFVFVSD